MVIGETSQLRLFCIWYQNMNLFESYSVRQHHWSNVFSESSAAVWGRGSACLGSASPGLCWFLQKAQRKKNEELVHFRPEWWQLCSVSMWLHLVSGGGSEQITELSHPAHEFWLLLVFFWFFFDIFFSFSFSFYSFLLISHPHLQCFIRL